MKVTAEDRDHGVGLEFSAVVGRRLGVKQPAVGASRLRRVSTTRQCVGSLAIRARTGMVGMRLRG